MPFDPRRCGVEKTPKRNKKKRTEATRDDVTKKKDWVIDDWPEIDSLFTSPRRWGRVSLHYRRPFYRRPFWMSLIEGANEWERQAGNERTNERTNEWTRRCRSVIYFNSTSFSWGTQSSFFFLLWLFLSFFILSLTLRLREICKKKQLEVARRGFIWKWDHGLDYELEIAVGEGK